MVLLRHLVEALEHPLGLLAVEASYHRLVEALVLPLGLLVLAYHQSCLALAVHLASYLQVLVGSFVHLDLFGRTLLVHLGIVLDQVRDARANGRVEEGGGDAKPRQELGREISGWAVDAIGH